MAGHRADDVSAVAPVAARVAIAATFVPGLVGLVAVVFAATLLLAYALLGFAVMHGDHPRRARRAPLCSSALYLSSSARLAAAAAIALLGLADTAFALRAPRRGAAAARLRPAHSTPNPDETTERQWK